MSKFIDLIPGTRYQEQARCVTAVLRDYRIHTLEDLENLPAKTGGKTTVCGFDVFQFIDDLRTLSSDLAQMPTIEEALADLEEEE